MLCCRLLARRLLTPLPHPILDRRIGSVEELQQEIHAWEAERNATKSVVEWRFTTADARKKLCHLYPPV